MTHDSLEPDAGKLARPVLRGGSARQRDSLTRLYDRIIAALVHQAENREPLTYSSPGTQVRLSARSLGSYLGGINSLLRVLSRHWNEGEIPLLSALVVQQQTGLPGAGFAKFTGMTEDAYRALLPGEKRRLVEHVQEQVYAYPKRKEVTQTLTTT